MGIPAEFSHKIFAKRRILSKSKSTACIPKLFEEIALCLPHRKAVLFDKKSMSYQELNEEANRVTGKLIDTGVQSNHVFMERTLQLISCILGILKVGQFMFRSL